MCYVVNNSGNLLAAYLVVDQQSESRKNSLLIISVMKKGFPVTHKMNVDKIKQ